MPFERNPAFEKAVGAFYGEYESTLHSRTGEVRAYSFKRNGQRVAHITFPAGIQPEDACDPYLGELKNHALQCGFKDNLGIIYSE